MKQTGLTFVLRVKPDAASRDALKAALAATNERIHGERQAFSRRHPTLHYTSFLLVERNRADSDPVDLVWEVNCDGSGGTFVKQFVDTELGLLTDLFQYCDGGPGKQATPADVSRFLRGKAILVRA